MRTTSDIEESDSEIDIGQNIALNSDSSSDSESDNSSETEVQDEIEYSDNQEEEVKEDKRTDKENNTKSKNDFPQLDGNVEVESDDDDINDYFATTHLDTKKFKKGSFASFGFNRFIMNNINKKGYKQPTPIQRKTIPLILQKRDIVGMARTGSGKTAAFLLPMIEKLKTHSSKIGVRGVILSPSREIAIQTHRVFKEFSKNTELRSVLLTGGDSLEDQFGMMMSNPDVVIATPGRFLHLKVEMKLDLKSVEYIVFDEADRLFEMGFEEQLNELLAALPDNRQSLLFSATLPNSLVEFAKAGLKNPVLVKLDQESKISDNLEMLFLSCKKEERESNLLFLLQDVIGVPVASTEEMKRFQTDSREVEEKEEKEKEKGKEKEKRAKYYKSDEIPHEQATIIFVPTRHHVEYISQLLMKCGYLVSYLYGTLDQHARRNQLRQFCFGITRILVVTDVAARGVDIPLLPNVINYSLPGSSKIFVHRVGRTARAGNRGWAYSIVSESELPYLVELGTFLGKKVITTGMVEKLGVSFDKISYNKWMVLGSGPRVDVESFGDLYKNVYDQEFDLQMSKKTCEKAEKLYLRTRGGASNDSVKRSKELILQKWDGQNVKFGQDLERAKLELLNKFALRKNKETVFEFGKNGEDEMSTLMNRRWKVVKGIERKAKRRREMKEEEEGGVEEELQFEEELGSGSGPGPGQGPGQDLVDAGNYNGVFEDGDAILNGQTKKRKTFKDERFFLSHYADPKKVENEEVVDGFINAASEASYDLNNDEKIQVHKQSSATVKWDRKRKKYVNLQGIDNKKYIIGESGRKIPATFRSGKYEEWAKARNINTRNVMRVGARESEGSVVGGGRGGGGGRFKHKLDKKPKMPDKYRDDYKKQKEKNERAVERGVMKGKRGYKDELKNVAEIRKNRVEKEKRRAKNGRPGRERR
ncbi:hypothetical protein TBLA_0B01590 [Henningerozyma blattae CBS 6284]|uniref:ATP-dependent RNA helicase DBP10 n=1 Tax=Henningerozyma blattae (strain ATCC 34711 / CBS 6284 / DSM 70876 / NBRC 10599 / NRRL Y-10934 / UCD 77-7) TaxID=1071380 RepID=I2GY00_HENB6|nr:hypothetical protein TBLA_0B01590 [Tetrapisispora blattae CBS 6284]CCH59002.1 hypothetical protein TBLA_0B01590 [Tetrapisispora blattae CBS 6284]